jgi:DNA-binding Lrp family transcriptional regulator
VVTAYVMVKANTGDVKQLRKTIRGVGSVDSCHIVAGDVDLIAKLRAENPDGVLEVVGEEMLGLDGVEDTQTYLAMD